MTIEEEIISKIKNIPVDNYLEYINELINELLKLYQNPYILSKELFDNYNITLKLNELYDLKLKIISCQQIGKDK